MNTADLLTRLAATLKADIGPAVDDEYTRTQAFMASVVLERLAKQLALGPDHDTAEYADAALLHEQLKPLLVDAPTEVSSALTVVAPADIAAFGPVIDALYRWGLDKPQAVEALALIRVALRRDIDRRMEIAS